MKYKIPKHLLNYFESEALKHKDIETLALGLGNLNGETISVEELIFPTQNASSTHVEDTGIDGQETQLWISSNSQTFKRHKSQATYAVWIHSHVNYTKCFLSSVDLHIQHSFEHFYPNIIACVVEIGDTKVENHDFYQLSNENFTIAFKIEDSDGNTYEGDQYLYYNAEINPNHISYYHNKYSNVS